FARLFPFAPLLWSSMGCWRVLLLGLLRRLLVCRLPLFLLLFLLLLLLLRRLLSLLASGLFFGAALLGLLRRLSLLLLRLLGLLLILKLPHLFLRGLIALRGLVCKRGDSRLTLLARHVLILRLILRLIL